MKIRRSVAVILATLGILALSSGAYAWYLNDRILPNVWVGVVPVGGLTTDDAAARIAQTANQLERSGIVLTVNGSPQPISPDSVGFDVNPAVAAENAFNKGRGGSVVSYVFSVIASLWHTIRVDPAVTFDQNALEGQINDIAATTDGQGKDVRLMVNGATVTLLTDTASGRGIDQALASAQITRALKQLDNSRITLAMVDQPPVADPTTGPAALAAARAMVARPLTLKYEELTYTISRTTVGSWLTTTYDGPAVLASLDAPTIDAYVTTIAKSVNVAPEAPKISTTDGRVTGFVPSTVGRAVEETKLADLITSTLTSRATPKPSGDVLTIPVKSSVIAPLGLDVTSGISELIGKATTTFTGSPHNRILNIKNGIRFLSGSVVQPGAEFSTLATLGTIDNTTGYLPELVIKGDRTEPEFGGGLCQVSTTLFRAILNAGLPITERHNHSYRVSYYEKDANGVPIGPGLDATIYQPSPDLKFRNDTTKPILIIGYVTGDKATFELYGTKDGRTSEIIGPKKLTEIPAGDPVYIPTTDLPIGVTKQVETAHPGGAATATYVVTYPDGHQTTEVFNSWYRPWPEKFLIGAAASAPTP